MAQHTETMEQMIKTVMQKAPEIMHHIYALEGKFQHWRHWALLARHS